MIVIIDYGMGNLPNVKRALNKFTDDVLISSKKEDIIKADKLVLPGVGAFGDAMRNIDDLGLREIILEEAKKKPFLGICLGMQIMFEKSEEDSSVLGLGIVKGEVKKFSSSLGLKVPEIGWNNLEKPKESKILKGVEASSYFYFVHSYYVAPNEDIEVGTTNYGENFCSVLEKDNIMATQFHPEKSHNKGLGILKNFVEL